MLISWPDLGAKGGVSPPQFLCMTPRSGPKISPAKIGKTSRGCPTLSSCERLDELLCLGVVWVVRPKRRNVRLSPDYAPDVPFLHILGAIFSGPIEVCEVLDTYCMSFVDDVRCFNGWWSQHCSPHRGFRRWRCQRRLRKVNNRGMNSISIGSTEAVKAEAFKAF